MKKAMRERGLTFKDAVNTAIIEGLSSRAPRQPYSSPTFDMGNARLPVEQALRLAAELEDEELLRKRALGK